MNKKLLLVSLFLGVISAVGLEGCLVNVSKPLQSSPDQTNAQTVIEMKPGDKMLFKVFGTSSIPGKLECSWYLSGSLFSNEVLKGKSEYEFAPEDMDQIHSRITLGCSYDYFHFGLYNNCCGIPSPTIGWHGDNIGYANWDIRIIPETQPVFDGNYIVKNERDLELLKSYQIITGDLIIDHADFESLNGLEDLTAIGGNLFIFYTKLSDISGLKNLTKIGGELQILENQSLCNSMAEELRDQVQSREGIGGEVMLSNNKACTAP